ncbi:MAG: helix-turn-helix domain-containing protein [Acidimicrobiales bacterium]|nr:helix-turn-helix domain-containing protein [Acidimicrobiales bacterium]
MMDDEHCYRVASSRDGRFDGAFVTAVLTTGIYCRPSCPATTPKPHNVRFYATPAAAQDAGFRACKRCRPDAAPGSPEWDARADVVARAVRLIGDGVVEREGVSGLSRRLGYSARHLHRLMHAELGTGPLRLALAHRVQGARALLENTDLAVTDVAWAAGFGSIRQFNDRIREVYALSPTEIRRRSSRPAAKPLPSEDPRRHQESAHDVVHARLAYRPPLDLDGLLSFLGQRAIPGVEAYDGTTYSRVLRLPHGAGTVDIRANNTADHRTASQSTADRHPTVDCAFQLDDIRDYATAVSRTRRLLDLDADPHAIGAAFADDPFLGRPSRLEPGRRVPGTPDPEELALRAVLGQHVSLLTARALAARLTERWGEPLRSPRPGLTHAFPTAAALATAGLDELPMPRSRAQALHQLAVELTTRSLGLDQGADRDEMERALLAISGIGPWTAGYVRMRGLGDPDVFLATDLGVRRALSGSAANPTQWKPWRSYAVMHLWSREPENQPHYPTERQAR